MLISFAAVSTFHNKYVESLFFYLKVGRRKVGEDRVYMFGALWLLGACGGASMLLD